MNWLQATITVFCVVCLFTSHLINPTNEQILKKVENNNQKIDSLIKIINKK